MDYEAVMQRRRQRLLGDWTPSGKRGVEVGPLSRPVIKRTEAEVYYVDHCTTEELKQKYEGHDQVSEVEHVDFVWGEKRLPDLLENKAPIDFVVAAHVIEHVPDLRGWLGEVHDALSPGGRLLLIVPDKRFTFDIFRRVSSFDEVIKAHLERRRRPGLRIVLDHFTNVANVTTWYLWDDYASADYLHADHDEEFLASVSEKWLRGDYLDVHAWVFTPWHFFHLMDRMTKEMGLKFDLQHFMTTQDHDLEFYVQLEKVHTVTTDFASLAVQAQATALWPPGAPHTPSDGLLADVHRLTSEVVDLQHELEQASEKLVDLQHELEQASEKLNENSKTLHEIYTSTMWRAWQPLRSIGKRLPRSIRAYIRVPLSLIWWTLTFWRIPQRLRLGLRPWESVKSNACADKPEDGVA